MLCMLYILCMCMLCFFLYGHLMHRICDALPDQDEFKVGCQWDVAAELLFGSSSVFLCISCDLLLWDIYSSVGNCMSSVNI